MQPIPPAPYGHSSYARPATPVRYAQRITTPDGASLATFVYGPEDKSLRELLSYDPVLALHGNGGSHATFVKVIDRLSSAGLGVIAFDSRAQGQSTRGSAPLTYERMAADAVAVLDALDVKAAHVVGHSDGGIEALLLARDHASRTLSIMAGGANLTPEGVVDEWDMEGSIAANHAWEQWTLGGDVPDEVDLSLLPSAVDAQRSAELLQLMVDEPRIDATSLASITCPACVLVGEHDCITQEETKAIANAIPNARLVVVPSVGHSLPRQAPDSVACQVLINVLLAH